MILRAFIFLFTFLTLLPAYAAEIPTMGLVYNTKEVSSLSYDCQQSSDGLLECKFVQISARKKSKPEDLDKKVKDALAQFPEAIKEISSEGVCTQSTDFISLLEGEKTPEELAENASFVSNKEEFIKGMKSMSQTKKTEMLKTFVALDEFCKKKDEQSYLKLTKMEHDKEVRTCQVSSNVFTQTFKYVQDYTSNSGAWVVQSQPEGPCGIVQLSRFEPVITKIGDTNYTNWNYIAKKAITNPKGQAFLELKCSNLDQNEYVYDWQSSTQEDDLYRLGCDYIEFSPI